MPASATSKCGRNGEERAALLRVRTRPKGPESNGRELLQDSILNCEIARDREKLTGLNTLLAVRRTKGLRNSREELACSGLAHPHWSQKAGGRRKGQIWPQRRHPYHTANRPPVSNQRLPEILDG